MHKVKQPNPSKVQSIQHEYASELTPTPNEYASELTPTPKGELVCKILWLLCEKWQKVNGGTTSLQCKA